MTARKQCFLTIYVLHRHRGYCFCCFFSSYFLLFVTFGSTSPVYTVSGHSHTLDMNTVYAIAALFDAHRQRCHVDCSCTACILACRRSWQRGVCVLWTPLVCFSSACNTHNWQLQASHGMTNCIVTSTMWFPQCTYIPRYFWQIRDRGTVVLWVLARDFERRYETPPAPTRTS